MNLPIRFDYQDCQSELLMPEIGVMIAGAEIERGRIRPEK
jgi:hypothetical protein